MKSRYRKVKRQRGKLEEKCEEKIVSLRICVKHNATRGQMAGCFYCVPHTNVDDDNVLGVGLAHRKGGAQRNGSLEQCLEAS